MKKNLSGIKYIAHKILWNSAMGIEIFLDGDLLTKESIAKATQLINNFPLKKRIIYLLGEQNNENELLSTFIKLLRDYKAIIHLELNDPDVFPAYAALANFTILNLEGEDPPSIRTNAIKLKFFNDTIDPQLQKGNLPPILFLEVMPGVREDEFFTFLESSKYYWSVFSPIHFKKDLI